MNPCLRGGPFGRRSPLQRGPYSTPNDTPDASTFTARPRGRADDRPSYGAGHEEASGVLADLVDGGSTTMPAAWAANFDVL